MKLVVGLGNPGSRYAKTRHNVGVRVLAHLAARWRITLGQNESQALCGKGVCSSHDVLLAFPQTFMNASGRAVSSLMRQYALEAPDVLIVYDDVSLSLGRLRFRARGSDGGHRGMADVLEAVGHDRISRLKVGVDASSRWAPLEEWVLSDFSSAEERALEEILPAAAESIEDWCLRGIEEAMNRWNARLIQPS